MYSPIPVLLKRCMLSIPACAAISDEPSEILIEKLEAGEIRIGFNIGKRLGGKRCLRVLSTSLAQYLSGERRRTVETPASFRAEISAVIPALATTLQTENVARILNCDGEHVRHLIKSRALKLAREGRAGRNGSALVTRESLLNFLVERRVK